MDTRSVSIEPTVTNRKPDMAAGLGLSPDNQSSNQVQIAEMPITLAQLSEVIVDQFAKIEKFLCDLPEKEINVARSKVQAMQRQVFHLDPHIHFVVDANNQLKIKEKKPSGFPRENELVLLEKDDVEEGEFCLNDTDLSDSDGLYSQSLAAATALYQLFRLIRKIRNDLSEPLLDVFKKNKSLCNQNINDVLLCPRCPDRKDQETEEKNLLAWQKWAACVASKLQSNQQKKQEEEQSFSLQDIFNAIKAITDDNEFNSTTGLQKIKKIVDDEKRSLPDKMVNIKLEGKASRERGTLLIFPKAGRTQATLDLYKTISEMPDSDIMAHQFKPAHMRILKNYKQEVRKARGLPEVPISGAAPVLANPVSTNTLEPESKLAPASKQPSGQNYTYTSLSELPRVFSPSEQPKITTAKSYFKTALIGVGIGILVGACIYTIPAILLGAIIGCVAATILRGAWSCVGKACAACGRCILGDDDEEEDVSVASNYENSATNSRRSSLSQGSDSEIYQRLNSQQSAPSSRPAPQSMPDSVPLSANTDTSAAVREPSPAEQIFATGTGILPSANRSNVSNGIVEESRGHSASLGR